MVRAASRDPGALGQFARILKVITRRELQFARPIVVPLHKGNHKRSCLIAPCRCSQNSAASPIPIHFCN